MPGDRLQGTSGLGCTLDVGTPMAVQRLTGRQDDGEHDHVRKRRASEDVHATRQLLAKRPPAALEPQGERFVAALRLVAHLLQPVRALPEEQVGRDRRSQHGHQQRDVGGVKMELWGDGVV